ncbi:hypothetical protein BZG36_00197 [Bifiguratus adelaidae]|uniref:SNARE-complex protein Syntaxin-18 N-terminal domain-containing protein n=1 Tax=Bifiguratus adelaidae TaxID=1938954 RepID=A0A261Y8M4_9FUNG|nr:hypothetical protein BZG36_00197 [Bifiguratus adelaidae]
MDITHTFRSIVQQKAIHSKHTVQSPKQPNWKTLGDEFDKEAYRIAAHAGYAQPVKGPDGLSGPLTDKDRDEIDFQAKMIIRRCMERIRTLDEQENARQQNLVAPALPKWIAQAVVNLSTTQMDIVAVHRSGVLWWLNCKLMDASKIQKDQQEARVMRALEKSNNQLSNAIPRPKSSTLLGEPTHPTPTQIPAELAEEDEFERSLDPQELQQMQMENDAMLEELENTLDQVKGAEKALMDIASLQSELANHLAIQTAQTDKIYQDAIQDDGIGAHANGSSSFS